MLVHTTMSTTFLALGTGLSGPVAGRLAIRFGDSFVCIVSTSVFMVSCVLVAVLAEMSFTWWWLLAGFLAGASDGFQIPSVQKFASVHDISPRHAFEKFRALHSASVGLCVIIEAFTIQ
jgi:MFS family permease